MFVSGSQFSILSQKLLGLKEGWCDRKILFFRIQLWLLSTYRSSRWGVLGRLPWNFWQKSFKFWRWLIDYLRGWGLWQCFCRNWHIELVAFCFFKLVSFFLGRLVWQSHIAAFCLFWSGSRDRCCEGWYWLGRSNVHRKGWGRIHGFRFWRLWR